MKKILFLITIVLCLTSCDGIVLKRDLADYKYKWEVEVTYLKDDSIETLTYEMNSNMGQICLLKLTETGCLKGTCLIDEKIFISTGVKKFKIISEEKEIIEKTQE